MSKEEFLAQLRRGLAGLPQEDVEERLTFYSETIDDRIEEGLTEEAAVADVGDVDEIAALWAMELAVVACLLAGVVAGAVSLFRGGLSGLLLGGGLFSGGLAILLFFGCKAATAALLRLTRRMARGIKSLFIRKENNV